MESFAKGSGGRILLGTKWLKRISEGPGEGARKQKILLEPKSGRRMINVDIVELSVGPPVTPERERTVM